MPLGAAWQAACLHCLASSIYVYIQWEENSGWCDSSSSCEGHGWGCLWLGRQGGAEKKEKEKLPLTHMNNREAGSRHMHVAQWPSGREGRGISSLGGEEEGGQNLIACHHLPATFHATPCLPACACLPCPACPCCSTPLPSSPPPSCTWVGMRLSLILYSP